MKKSNLIQFLKTGVIGIALCLIQHPLSAETMTFKDSKIASVNMAVDSVDYWIEKMQPGDVARAQKLLGELEKVSGRLLRIQKSSENATEYDYVIGRIASATQAISIASGGGSDMSAETPTAPVEPTVTVSPEPAPASTANAPSPQAPAAADPNAPKPHPNLYPLRTQLEQLEAALTDVEEGAPIVRIESDFTRFKERFARIATTQHPDYVDVATRVAAFSSAIDQRKPQTDMTEAEMLSFLDRVREDYSKDGRFDMPDSRGFFEGKTLQPEAMATFISQVGVIRENLAKDKPVMDVVFAVTGKDRYWKEWLDTKAAAGLDSEIKTAVSVIASHLGHGVNEAEHRAGLDPKEDAYAFSGDVAQRSLDLYGQTTANLGTAMSFEEALGLDPVFAPMNDRITAAHQQWEEKRAEVAGLAELPADIGDKKLAGIAEGVLKKSEYEVGDWERLVVNAAVRSDQRIEHSFFSGKVRTEVRTWDEFQVTTVEKEEDGKFYLFTNTISYYHEAPNPTPVDEWILGSRVRGTEIAAENF
ncbi:MAG: hypothetical protein AAF236_13655 [Verrucomicrobiota bacterium]